MNKRQIIRTQGAEELVVLTRAEYETLVAKANAVDDEDAGLARIAANELRRLEVGAGVLLPAAVAEAITAGANPIKTIREWRGIHTQGELAERARTDQGTISALEHGRRRGSAIVLRKIAEALAVPMDLLVRDDLPGARG